MALVASGHLGRTGELAGSWQASVTDFIPPGVEEVFGLSRCARGSGGGWGGERGWREGVLGEPSQTHQESIHLPSSTVLHSPATNNRRGRAESTAAASNLSYLLDDIAFKGCCVKRSNLFYKRSKAQGPGEQWETLDSPGRVCSLHHRGGPTSWLLRHVLQQLK